MFLCEIYGLVLFDEKPNPAFSVENDLNPQAFKRFTDTAGITSVISHREILNNLSLIEENSIKNAGVLLFCNNVKKYFLNASIICVIFQGKDKYKIIDREEYDKDIYTNYENTIKFFQAKLNTEYIYPDFAWRRAEMSLTY